eukprot:CAMPEP_0184491622 /NCGR_PEP_ID=MMETSP0113_2-20130426/20883_1 /TAXON_ID=91329 /ORGANISM="Norrisiella sphaerica, Strain BC52" /LENGTH=353 /DNA_ID=CAMNT_0026876059 /DNA_START=87 /DNA_END=1148 /DNA_ORIENTATION=-
MPGRRDSSKRGRSSKHARNVNEDRSEARRTNPPSQMTRRKKKSRQRCGCLGFDMSSGNGSMLIVMVAVLLGVYLALAPIPPPPEPDEGGKEVFEFAEESPTLCQMEVLATYPHDPEAFTQGLLVHNGRLFESTGLYGKSVIKEVEIETGETIESTSLDDAMFGEGLTIFEDTLYQLTWRNNAVLRYSLDLKQKDSHHLEGEGWGLTTVIGTEAEEEDFLLLTNGTSIITFLDPKTLAAKRHVEVYFIDPRKGKRWPVSYLNELEFVDGRLYANMWGSDKVVVIDIWSGRVTYMLDLSILAETKETKYSASRENVLNGIAFDSNDGSLYLTGKRWPHLYKVKLPTFDTCAPLTR